MDVPRSIRLHRDNATLRDAGQPPHDARASTPEVVLARGHKLLRFPAELEAAFQAEALEPRLRLLITCGFLGVVGVLVGTLNVDQLTPEIAGIVWQLVWLWVISTGGLLAGVWCMPQHWRRPWQGEALTAFMATAMGLLITWMATASRADTAFTHSATAAMPVMYSCIATRLRFYWALPGALLSFGCYAFFVTGFTPEQALLASGTLKLMSLSYVFSLAANYVFEYRERRNWLLRKVEAQQRNELVAASAHLETLSIQDPLTGLANRRQFDKALAQARTQAAANRRPLALLFVDVDYFKPYNDRHGHPAGDDCLVQVAQVLSQVAEAHGGSAARLGGEEFGILLPDHTLGKAEAVGLALCQAVEAARIDHGASSVSPVVTVSVGAAQDWPGQTPSATTLMQQADLALYQAKLGGRNRVSTDASQPMAVGSSMAYATPQAAEPTLAEPDAAERATDALLTQTLEGRFILSLRFPTALERLYRRGRSNQRRKQLAVASVIGLIIYNGFIFANRAMFPDIGEDVLMVQLWLSLFMMIMTITGFLMRMPLAWREALYCLGTSVVAVISTWVLAHSQQTSALSFAVSLALIPMFSGVGARQPFWYTCATALISCVGAAWLLTPHDALQRLVYIDSLFVIVNLTAYTLILAYTLEHSQRKEWLLAQIDERQRQALEAATQRLQQLSAVDPLTGICNRRQFEHDLNRIWQESLQDGRPVAMLIVDVDHFKPYNDGYGHPQGDQCLRQVADILTKTAHAGKGLAARMGGEEFGILLPGGSVDDAVALGQRLCEAVRAANIAHSYSGAGIVTISVGVASIRPDAGVDRISLFATADKALYEAKRMGRNRVVAPSTPGFRA